MKDNYIEIELQGESPYDIVESYAKKFIKNNPSQILVVRIGLSYNGYTYNDSNEIIYTYGDDLINPYDWYGGEPYFRIYGIKSVDALEISGGIYE